jgi:hypothetical protein
MNRLQWEKRLIPISNDNTRGITGWGVEIHDLVIGKFVSGREKDFEFNKAVFGLGLVSMEVLQERIENLEVPEAKKDQIRTKMKTDFLQGQPGGKNS